MDKLIRSKRKFELTITIFVSLIILTTISTGAFHTHEIDRNEVDDENGNISSTSSKFSEIVTLSSDREGLFLDIVDESQNVGKHTSIDVVEFGEKKVAYISYYSESLEALKIAQNDMNEPEEDWEIWTIDRRGKVGEYSSIEIDGKNRAHISYYDATNTQLKYTIWCAENNRIINTEVIDDKGDVGRYTSLELDEYDDPRVSYHESFHGSLRYAERDNDGWRTFTVTDDGEKLGSHTSLALDSDSKPHISFYDWEGRDLKYAEGVIEESIQWKVQTVEEAGELVGKYTSLELDKNDRPHISCYEWTDENKRLKYVTRSMSGVWTSEEISPADPSGTYTSIELYGAGDPLISYHEWGEENLRLAVKEDGEWKNVKIDTEGRVGSYTSLDYIGQAETHISYYDQNKGDLRHARYFFKNRTPLSPESFNTKSEYGDVILEWEPPIYDGIKTQGDHILGYHVYRSIGDGFEKIGNVTGLSYRDRIAVENETKTYEYRVAAVNRKGVGDNSSVIKTRARYFSYERSLEKANEYGVIEEGLLPFKEDEDGPYEVRWDLDYDPNEGPRWEDHNFKEEMYKKYDEVGLKNVLLEYENGNGDKRRCLQSAWVLGELDLISTYEESGSEEKFFHLPEDKSPFEDLASEGSLKNTYKLRAQGVLPYEQVEFEFLEKNKTVDDPAIEENKKVWEETFNVSDSREDTKVEVVPYLYNKYRDEIESPLHTPHEIRLKNEKEVEIIDTPDWFPYLLDAFFGDNLEIDNIEEDGDYIGWEVGFEIPEIDDEDGLRDALDKIDISGTPELDILEDLERFFGGDYGFELELFPDREIKFDNNLDFETTLIEFYTDVDEDEMGIDSFDGELGNSFDYAADPEMEVSAGISVDLLVKKQGINVLGELEIEVGAGIQIDIPLKSIGFAEVGLTAEIGGEIGVEYEVGALDYGYESGLSLDPGDSEVPIEFLLNFGGGPYGEVGAGLARVEGKLVLEVIVGLELPSKDTGINHAGRFEVEVSAGWGLWSRTREWELYSTEESTSMIKMNGTSPIENDVFTRDTLATRDYDLDEEMRQFDSTGILERKNVGPRADPQIASIDGEKGIAVWSELSKESKEEVQSDLFMQEFSDGEWKNTVELITTDGNMAFEPELISMDEKIVLIYKEIEERPKEFDDVEELEDYYTNDTLRGKLWDGQWSDLELNYSIEDQAINSFDVEVDDQNKIHVVYRSSYPTLDMFESSSSFEGNIGILKQKEGGWIEVLEREDILPQSSRPSIEFLEDAIAIVYTRTIEDTDGIYDEACYNQTIFVPIDGEEKVIRETPNTTSHQILSKENGNFVTTWVENHTEIRRKVLEAGVVPDEYTSINSGEMATGLSHHVNETNKYYVFQKGVNAVPTIIESSDDDWSKERSVLDKKTYAANQIDPDFSTKDSTIVLVEKQEVIESWHCLHYRFDGSLSDSVVTDRSGESNEGELKGNWSRDVHDPQKAHGRYGNYVSFEDEDSEIVVNHSSTLNVTSGTEDFTVTTLLNEDDYGDGDYLMRKEGSWGVLLNENEIEIELWNSGEKYTFSTEMKFSSGWKFFALRYEEEFLNVTLKNFEASSSLEKNTTTFNLDDFSSLSSSIEPLRLAEGSGNISIDDFRLVKRYLPDASIEKIIRTSYPNFDAEYSVKSKKIPPYVNFTHTENPALGAPVEFTAHSLQETLNYSWSFENGEKKFGEEIEHEFIDTGHHTVTLDAVDKETGASTRYEKTLHVIDIHPPRFDVKPEVVEKYEENNSVRLKWEEAEGESEPFEYRIHHETGEDVEFDHDYWKESTRKTSIVIEDLDPNLMHNILVSVVNVVGLTNTSAEFVSFEVENNLPPKFEGLNSTFVDHSDKSIDLRWEEADDPSELIYYNIYHSRNKNISFENHKNTTFETEKRIYVNEVGKHYFAVRAEDERGNEDSNEEVKVVEVKDVRSPEIEITSPSEGESVGSTVTVEWSGYDNNSGISSYRVKRDDQNWNEVEEQNYTFKNLPEGKRTLTVKAIDNYNNSGYDSIDVKVVEDPTPEIDFYSPSPVDGSIEVSTDVELSVKVEHENNLDLDVSFYNSYTDEQIGIDEEVSSGERASTEVKGLENSNEYEWYVEADDGEYRQKSTVWNFTTSYSVPEEHNLKIDEPVGRGTVEVDGEEIKDLPHENFYYNSTEVDITARSKERWRFNGWKGDVAEDEEGPKITIIMDEDKEITAVFEEIKTYELMVNTDGEGSVDIYPNQSEYEENTEVTLTAEPAYGWYFEKWTGDYHETEDNITIRMDDNKEIFAVFLEDQKEDYDLIINIEGKGSVDIDPEQDEYEEDTKVTLRAEPNKDWEFSHWDSDIMEEKEDVSDIIITVDSDVEITAHFEEKLEKDEDSTGISAPIFSIQTMLGIVLLVLIAAVFVLYRRSDGGIF